MRFGFSTSNLPRIPRRAAQLVAAAALCTALGCQHVAYRAADLPAQYAAPQSHGAADFDLSQFARPTANSDVVQVGDILEISISTGLEQRFIPSWKLRVDERGEVTVPLVGPVRVGGMVLGEADFAVYRAAVDRGLYRNPNVSVVRVARRQNRVVVAGAVKKPGAYDLPVGHSDVLAAIVAAGGLGDKAGTVVEIRQPGSEIARHDGAPARLTSFEPGGASAPPAAETIEFDLAQAQHLQERDVLLGDGAVVTVRERPARAVYVLGKVKKPGHVEMPAGADLHLLDAIALAGGRTVEFADKVYIVRHVPDSDEPLMIQASLRSAKGDPASNLRLAPGDVVSVEETPLTFTLETLQKIIRFGFSSRVLF